MSCIAPISLAFPEARILLQPALEVGKPRLNRRQRNESFVRVRHHLRLSNGKTAHEVEEIFHHFLPELIVGISGSLKRGEGFSYKANNDYFREILTVAGVCCIRFDSGSMDTPICAMCEIGRFAPKTFTAELLDISSSFFN